MPTWSCADNRASILALSVLPLFHVQSEIHVEVHDGNVLRFGHVPGSGAGRA